MPRWGCGGFGANGVRSKYRGGVPRGGWVQCWGDMGSQGVSVCCRAFGGRGGNTLVRQGYITPRSSGWDPGHNIPRGSAGCRGSPYPSAARGSVSSLPGGFCVTPSQGAPCHLSLRVSVGSRGLRVTPARWSQEVPGGPRWSLVPPHGESLA